MPRTPGHDPGQSPPPGFTWGDYVDSLVVTSGSLAAVAERLASQRGFTDDVGSVERALRRLRTRGQLGGGTWGARALTVFGLPAAADARARWMGAYHSRFTDLPVPLCLDLVRLWDRPPISEAPAARLWLVLAHATCAQRGGNAALAAEHLDRSRAALGGAPTDARCERLLALAFLASREDPSEVAKHLGAIEPLLRGAMADADRACLHARWIDQRAYELNKGRGASGDTKARAAAAEILYLTIPTLAAPPFALCRRASGLAYARWKQGDRVGGAELSREAARHAGDGGHLRLRAMSLQMRARIVGGEEGERAKARALAIVTALDDEGLRLRFTRT